MKSTIKNEILAQARNLSAVDFWNWMEAKHPKTPMSWEDVDNVLDFNQGIFHIAVHGLDQNLVFINGVLEA